MNTNNNQPIAGLFRRFAALLYDGLLIIAIEMIAGGVVIAALHALQAIHVVTFAPYLDASDFLTQHPIWSPIYTAYLASVWISFFVFFWTRAGQTLGMRAWRMQLTNLEGGKITLTQAMIRLGTSGFGLANLVVPLDPQKRGFHDIWAKTQVIVLPKD